MSKLPNDCTENDRRIQHIEKMRIKKIRYDGFEGWDRILANLSPRHPNWGEVPAENERRMLEKVVDKSA